MHLGLWQMNVWSLGATGQGQQNLRLSEAPLMEEQASTGQSERHGPGCETSCSQTPWMASATIRPLLATKWGCVLLPHTVLSPLAPFSQDTEMSTAARVVPEH